jgi:hypothetical protein
MSNPLNRRALLAGGGAAVAIVLVGGGFAATRLLPLGETGSPDAAAEAYVKLLAEVRDDYINGNVVEHDGWIISQHEQGTLAERQKARADTSETTTG